MTNSFRPSIYHYIWIYLGQTSPPSRPLQTRGTSCKDQLEIPIAKFFKIMTVVWDISNLQKSCWNTSKLLKSRHLEIPFWTGILGTSEQVTSSNKRQSSLLSGRIISRLHWLSCLNTRKNKKGLTRTESHLWEGKINENNYLKVMQNSPRDLLNYTPDINSIKWKVKIGLKIHHE